MERVYAIAVRDILGLRCGVEEPGWLTIESGDGQFHLHLDEADPGMCRLATSSAWPAGTATEHATAAAARMNRTRQGVKATLTVQGLSLVLAAEHIIGAAGAIPDPGHLAVVLARALTDLADARREFPGEVLLAHLAADAC